MQDPAKKNDNRKLKHAQAVAIRTWHNKKTTLRSEQQNLVTRMNNPRIQPAHRRRYATRLAQIADALKRLDKQRPPGA